MQTVNAVYSGGVLAPEQPLDLAEGSRVVLRVEAPPDAIPPEFMPDVVIETGENRAPFDLPLPGEPTRIRARLGGLLLPDPPLVVE